MAKALALPIAFQNIDPVAEGWDESQAKTLESLRESFLAEVGGVRQNAYDPAYAERWRKALPANDAQLRLFFGAAFAERVALEAAQAQVAATQASRGRAN